MSKFFSCISFIVLARIFRSLFHLTLICMCGIIVKIYLYFPNIYIVVSSLPFENTNLWHSLKWFGTFAENQLAIKCGFWSFHSFHWFMNLSLFQTLCFYYCSFILLWNHVVRVPHTFSQNYLACPDPLPFHINFKKDLWISSKVLLECDWHCIEPVCQYENDRCLKSVDLILPVIILLQIICMYIYIIWEACQVLPPWNYSFKEGLTSLGSDTACWANPQQVYFLTLFGSSPSILPALSLCRDAPFTLTLHPAVLFNLLSNCFVSTDGITTPPCREGMEKRKKAWEREGIFLIFSSYIGSVSFTLDNFLDFMFQFFDTSFNYVSHGHFYICCIILFSIS